MVFKKGHKPVRRKSEIKSSAKPVSKSVNDVSDFYVKFGVKHDIKRNLSNISYLISELKKSLGTIAGFREKKALLRKELYETIISLRLNLDLMDKHMPSKEFDALKKKLDEIEKFAVKKDAGVKMAVAEKKETVAEKKPEDKKAREIKKPAPIIKKKDDLYAGASDAEKKELEALKKDLEEIKSQLGNSE
ncbi:MAG: hypothetical protein PHS81_00785 [Candidatus Nanoarchaeia archaeon]|nr:hypothetical protein [Candidatus Nanoarchaeia archaeon]